ncbi:MAG: hypothetical protein ACT4OM_13750 [Actinomycetota bacterium]
MVPIPASDPTRSARRGAKTYIRLYPDEEVVIVVMTNRDATSDEKDADIHFGRDMGNQLGTKILNWIDR